MQTCLNAARGVPFLSVACAAVAIVAAAVGGCRRGELAVAPAEGQVLYVGKPLTFGSVTFQPDVGPPARGSIQSNGRFRLSTYRAGDGAVLGVHRVCITCVEGEQAGDAERKYVPEQGSVPVGGLGRSLIPQKYARIATSGLQVEVKRENEPFVFDLTH